MATGLATLANALAENEPDSAASTPKSNLDQSSEPKGDIASADTSAVEQKQCENEDTVDTEVTEPSKSSETTEAVVVKEEAKDEEEEEEVVESVSEPKGDVVPADTSAVEQKQCENEDIV